MKLVNPFADRLSARLSRCVRFSVWIATVVALGCRPGAERQTAPAANDIPVGVYAATSGSEAAFGQATVQGVKLAAEEINNSGGVLGKKIRLIVEDDAGRAEEAASVVTKLITRDGVIGVIGENSSNQSLAAAPICQAAKVPMISPSSTNPNVTKKGDYIFRVCFTDPYQGKALATFVRNNLGVTSVAVLKDNKNDYSVGLAEFFSSAFIQLGGKIVAEQSYTGGDTEFRPQLRAIKSANPKVLLIPGFYTEVRPVAN